MSDEYIIRGGEEGRARLAVLGQAMAPTTNALLDLAGIGVGANVLDAGCGGGDVSREFARRVGPKGRVTGLDFDATKIAAAKEESKDLANVSFRAANVLEDDLGSGYDIVYARFLLSHLHEPYAALARLHVALKPGGMVILEDVDFSGHFCHPPRASFDRYVQWYIECARRRGADPLLGRRLAELAAGSGFTGVQARASNPASLTGPIKQMATLTLHAIAGPIVEFGLASEAEVQADVADLQAAGDDPAVLMSVPRIVQCWGRKT